ncbi:Cation efflux system protein CusB precursor [Planctomycetes bacterium Pan216]|uniref:Cation efflux system protein CusB n=1 Tax=Kolteria novifilia TaxID=2527975 RepID=A0A518BAR2_9BACT|nr:Cation efflux system protein CusB precursor [Planctomycetes bacterium Pan216]
MSNEPTHRHPGRAHRWWFRTLVQTLGFAAVGIGLIALLGVAQRVGWLSDSTGISTAATQGDVVYTCPMHPQIRQPNPGRCPICGMELVVAAPGGQADDHSVTIAPAARRLANIQTAEAKLVPLDRTIRAVGSITFDESRVATIAAYVDGRIERMFADYTGVPVVKGDHLVVLYSPELYSAQFEFLASQRRLREVSNRGNSGLAETQERLADHARQKLLELGMTAKQVDELRASDKPESRLTIYSPIGGTVTEKLAVEGQYVETGQPIYRIVDLSMVWLVLKLFPEDATSIRFGQQVKAKVQSLPRETFDGRVAFINPVVDPRTRTVDVRVEIPNPKGKLRPGDYATATITVPVGPAGEIYDAKLAGKWISPMHPQIVRDQPGTCPICGMQLVPTSDFGFSREPLPHPESLVVPRQAVLMVGDHAAVYVETEAGKFELRPVTLGLFTAKDAVILSRLEPGEKVATAGNFLIDSQMQLSGKPSLVDPSRAIVSQPDDHTHDHVDVKPLSGSAGKAIEQLYTVYVSIQKSLAKDTAVSKEQATNLSQAATLLSSEKDLPEEVTRQAALIAQEAATLAKGNLEQDRAIFKTISHAALHLAAVARGSEAKRPLIQYHCSMVEGGQGDWLQFSDHLLNPYWGSQMLHCGDTIRTFPLAGASAPDHASQHREPADAKSSTAEGKSAATKSAKGE